MALGQHDQVVHVVGTLTRTRTGWSRASATGIPSSACSASKSPSSQASNKPDPHTQSPLKSPRHFALKPNRCTPSLLRSRPNTPITTIHPNISCQTFPIASTLLPNLQLLRIQIHHTRIAATPTALSRRRFDRFLVAESGFEERRFSRRRGTGFEQARQGWRELFGFFGGWSHDC